MELYQDRRSKVNLVGVSGLVYATVFGSAFSAASGKLYELQAKFAREISMLDQIYTLTMKLNLTRDQKITICKVRSVFKGEL